MAEAFARSFYNSAKWKGLRAAIIQERGPVCQRCGRIVSDTTRLIAHHKKALTPDNLNDVKISLNAANIELVCFDCHNKEHERYGYKQDGSQRKVFLVYGSPCSGKSTLVNQLMERGDILVDMDKIYQSISGCGLYDKPNGLRFNAFKVRDLLIDQIKTRYGQWRNAYIIGGYPLKADRERLIAMTGADELYCESTLEECLTRTKMRGVFANEWEQYVRRWWSEYQR